MARRATTMSWPPHADHDSNAEQLGSHLRAGGFTGLVILTGPENRNADDRCPLLGRESVQHLVRITRELPEIPGELPRLYVVTRNAQTVVASDVANLEQAGLRGLMRVVGIEHPHLRASQIDVDDATDAEQLAQQLLSGSEEDETAWRDGAWYAARLSPTPLRPEERHTAVNDHERDGMRLQIRTPGDLESMELVACERVPPGPGQIEVAVSASSINFADVLIAFGRYPAFDGQLPQLGTDFTGVVTAVGPDVTDHAVGDHVGGLCADGCWATFITCDARRAVTLPAGLADEQAAAVTTAHATAWYGLHDLARIRSGDKVLIHSATGGVGQAAIAIARAAGAEIFATAGSEQRRQLLRDMGIEHVYDSRSLEFADRIPPDTDGYGVDIVLNSVSGAAQRAGLELLALGGRFVEIGKRDIYGDTRLGLFPFRRNLAFYAVDLGLLAYSHPDRLRDLLSTVYQATADGRTAGAAEHALPACRCRHGDPADEWGPTQRQTRSRCSAYRQASCHGAAGTGQRLPPRRRLHHHRRTWRPGVVPGREDGVGRLRAHRALLALPPNARGAADDRSHPRDRHRRHGGVRRHRQCRHGAAPGIHSYRHRPSRAGGAACGGGGRGCHSGQHHRRDRRA